ncbi:transcriptional regulator TACO1-like protein [Xylariaceae sp. FL0255]|nr:transcriptional regulator TACO1-like protein [Xylariaceae sp. FL0255]
MTFFSGLLPSPARALGSTSIAICAQCRRSFASNAVLYSGHNKWSKIKHEKAAADKKKTAVRTMFAKQLTMYTRFHGADPNLNSQLASTIAAAKKAGMPKANIDTAIARGQGKSDTGAGLEPAIYEAMLAPSISLLVDIETDNKQRSLKDLRSIVKRLGGISTPTAFLFTRRGRVVLEKKQDGDNDFDDVMMQALEVGSENVEQDVDDNYVVWTAPNVTQQVAQDLAKVLGLELLSSEIIWSCTSDKVKVDDPEAADGLAKILAAVQEYPDVTAVYMNAERGGVSEESWSAVEDALES